VWNSKGVRTEVDRECLSELDSVSVSEVLGSNGVRVIAQRTERTRTDFSVENNS
jgi:hypothetical protein